MKNIPKYLLDSITEKLIEEFNPEKIILFGSHAWGTPTDDSDLDICVIVSNSDEPLVQRMRRADNCLDDFRVSKDILVKTRTKIEEYKDVISSLERRILFEGRILYANK
jgi:uncharacterized protein